MTTPKPTSRVPKHPAARVLEENLEEHGGVKKGGNKVRIGQGRKLALSPLMARILFTSRNVVYFC